MSTRILTASHTVNINTHAQKHNSALKIFSRFCLAAFAALSLLVTVGCSTSNSSSLVSVSQDQALASKKFDQVLVMAMTEKADRRRAVEDSLVKSIQSMGANAVASYTYMETLALDDEAALREAAIKAVKESGANGVFVGKLLREEHRTDYAPPSVEQTMVPTMPYYMGIGPYVGYGYQTVVTPGEIMESTTFYFQSTVFDVASTRPVWRAQSKTLNPDSFEQMLNDEIQVLSERLKEDGLFNFPSDATAN